MLASSNIPNSLGGDNDPGCYKTSHKIPQMIVVVIIKTVTFVYIHHERGTKPLISKRTDDLRHTGGMHTIVSGIRMLRLILYFYSFRTRDNKAEKCFLCWQESKDS